MDFVQEIMENKLIHLQDDVRTLSRQLLLLQDFIKQSFGIKYIQFIQKQGKCRSRLLDETSKSKSNANSKSTPPFHKRPSSANPASFPSGKRDQWQGQLTKTTSQSQSQKSPGMKLLSITNAALVQSLQAPVGNDSISVTPTNMQQTTNSNKNPGNESNINESDPSQLVEVQLDADGNSNSAQTPEFEFQNYLQQEDEEQEGGDDDVVEKKYVPGRNTDNLAEEQIPFDPQSSMSDPNESISFKPEWQNFSTSYDEDVEDSGSQLENNNQEMCTTVSTIVNSTPSFSQSLSASAPSYRRAPRISQSSAEKNWCRITTLQNGGTGRQCLICKKVLGQWSSFTRHMKTHTMEKPFSCALCGTNYSRRDHLLRHLRTKHGCKAANEYNSANEFNSSMSINDT